MKQSGKRDELVKRVAEYEEGTMYSTRAWLAAKVIKESNDLRTSQGVHSKVFVPVMPKSDWRSFQSQDIPTLFNYGHVQHYVLESIQVKTGS